MSPRLRLGFIRTHLDEDRASSSICRVAFEVLSRDSRRLAEYGVEERYFREVRLLKFSRTHLRPVYASFNPVGYGCSGHSL